MKREAIIQKTPAKAPYVCHPSGKQGLAKFVKASGSMCTKAVARMTPVPTVREGGRRLEEESLVECLHTQVREKRLTELSNKKAILDNTARLLSKVIEDHRRKDS
jgi:hypothetical protein